jgi:predicted GNAT superfamily acetyltransferase
MMVADPVVVREIHDNADLARIPTLEAQIWGNDETVPDSLLRVIVDHGGALWVAAPTARPDDWLGFCLALPARDEEGWYLHSHSAGVLPGHRSQGIGSLIKGRQREWAARAGYSRIGWTFDPMRPANAHFNLTVLGARVTAYYPCYYPALRGGLNGGRPTDRLMVMWDVDRPPRSTGQGQVTRRIELPANGDALFKTDPRAFHEAAARVREAFQAALGAGETVVGFAREPVPHYQLTAAATT